MNRRKNGTHHDVDADTMLPEYDFSKAVRGQTHRRYAEGTNIVVIDPDLAKVFPNTVAVNDALRVLARLNTGKHRRPRRKKTA